MPAPDLFIEGRNSCLVLGWLLLALCTGQSAAAATCPQALPPPLDVSAALRASIEQQPARARTDSVPQSAADWREIQTRRNRARADESAQVRQQFSIQARRDSIGGVPVAWLIPPNVARQHEGHLFIFLHGGGYLTGADAAGWTEGMLIAAHAGIPVLAVDYRMPPDHPFPAAIEDVAEVFRVLLKRYEPGALAIGGTSAGSGLALASLHNFLKLGLPMPAAVFAGTPWVDMTKTGDTHFTNAGVDRVLYAFGARMQAGIDLYANGHDVRDPLISPLYGDFSRFPPVMLVSGTRDLFLSDVVRMHRRMRAAGVAADLHVFEAMSHADYLVVWDSPETVDLYRELGSFLAQHLPR